MGPKLSKATVIQEDILKNMTNILNETVQKISSANSANSTAGQQVSIILTDGAVLSCGGNLNVVNESSITSEAISQVDATQITDISTNLELAFKASVEANIDQLNEIMAEFFSAEQKNIAEVVNSIVVENQTDISSLVSQTINQVLYNSVNSKQEIGIYITRDSAAYIDGDCNLTQESQIRMFSDLLCTAYFDSMMETKTAQDFTTELDAAIEQENKSGIDIVMILVIIGVVVVVCAVLYFMLKKKQ